VKTDTPTVKTGAESGRPRYGRVVKEVGTPRPREGMTAPQKMATEIERVADRARFVISAADPLYQDRLEHLGYLGIGADRFATLWFADSASVPRYHERFAASIEQMVLQSARLVSVPWDEALLEFLRRAEGSDLNWWLYGSAALAVRGIEITPGDIDINVSDAFLAGALFDDLLITPVLELDAWVARRIGRAFSGAIIEWLSKPHAELDDPVTPHEQGPHVADRLETVEWRRYRVHVPPLSVQLATCERRGLADRIESIRAAMGH
jgi:hypothetical protein